MAPKSALLSRGFILKKEDGGEAVFLSTDLIIS